GARGLPEYDDALDGLDVLAAFERRDLPHGPAAGGDRDAVQVELGQPLAADVLLDDFLQLLRVVLDDAVLLNGNQRIFRHGVRPRSLQGLMRDPTPSGSRP